jgi:phosphoribosylformimino-5-aminoimidazole carboxamide ribonucleotide (ProFAR) isomerase
MSKTYQVNVRRDGRWWYFEIPEINMSGQARRLSEVPFESSDIIATWLKTEPEKFTVDLNVDLPQEVRATWQEAKSREAAARSENAAAARLARQAVKQLRADGLTLAETGRLLGVSMQRVSQLSANTTEESKTAPVEAESTSA